MLPIRWRPLRELSTLQRDVDELFNRAFGRHGKWMPHFPFEGAGYPAIDCVRKEDSLLVRAELPGIDPKDVDISVTGNILTIRGEHKEERESKEEDYFMHEISRGEFERALTLPEGVNTEKIKASYRDGILEISMPAKGISRAKKIPIESVEETRKIKAA